MIRAENLNKRYGDRVALDGVSITAHEGEILGIFGVSGAGKSTLINILAGIESPDTGSVSTSITTPGIRSQHPSFHDDLTPMEALWLHGVLCEIPRSKRRTMIRETLTLVGLESHRNRRIGSLSNGGRTQLELACSLVSKSDLLLLDEPMAGLDSSMRRRLWKHLLHIRTRDAKTIIVGTSRHEDAELCNRVILLHEGRVLAEGTPAELRRLLGPETLVIRRTPSRSPGSPQALRAGITAREQDDTFTVEVNSESTPIEVLRQIPGGISAVRIDSRKLDSVLEEIVSSDRPADSRQANTDSETNK